MERYRRKLERNTIETSYKAQFIPNKSRISERPRREHCSANGNQIRMMDLTPGQQVRIERPTANGTTYALYTIDAHDEEEPDNTVYVGYTEPEDLQNRLGLCSIDSFRGKINAQVAAVGLSDDEAEAYSEFIEHLADNDYNSELAVFAPHGGDIEKRTDEQAKHVAEQLSYERVSVWTCKGFKKGGGAFDRWHITSTDINEESFPKLQTISERKFKYIIAFHGWKHNSICIGGSMPDRVKREIKTEIANAVSGSIAVRIAGDDGACPDDFNGDDQNNIVNRLGTYGLQIEQSEKARESYGIAIAKAVADVFRLMIKV